VPSYQVNFMKWEFFTVPLYLVFILHKSLMWFKVLLHKHHQQWHDLPTLQYRLVESFSVIKK
jgi:hypothetical protein